MLLKKIAYQRKLRRWASFDSSTRNVPEMFEEERKSRLQREAVLSKRLTDHEHEVAEKFEGERGTREQKLCCFEIK